MASTSSLTTTSSADLNSTPTRWDVFLSFRGTDTRYKFTSHLYAALDRYGVRTFKDDPELRSGEVISDALLEAIQGSRSYIVVFSENYASSPWCLDELIEIYNCHKTFSRLVIPVFYNIDPSVVRHQIGGFKEAFEKHQIRFLAEMDKVNKWRLALTGVANFSGKHVSKNRSEADIIIEIVDEILLEIDPKTLDVAKYPVGLDFFVKDIKTLLSSGTEGVIRFGIFGMGGVGKTTLAKALYNQLLAGGSFKDTSFLANCGEVSRTGKGLVSLQQQLIDDVLKSKNTVEVDNVDKGIKLIGARICSKKVLVVIDDLDHHKQFDYLVGPFATGSVVIITTRDEELLDKIDVEPKYRYRLNELDDDKSLILFNQHAFGNSVPNSTFMVLTEVILCHAGGLPLALEVFGSYLNKRHEAGWICFIKKLQRIPDSTIQQRLIVSLDALESDDPMLKRLFLDIACFFIGREKKEAVKLLETYYTDVDYNIHILTKRCLLTIDSSNELGMHDLLRDMGREVSRNNFPNEPGKHSRLWAVEDIRDVLKTHTGTEVIEGSIPRDFKYLKPLEGISFTTETFKRMGNLRFLHLTDVDIVGSFEQTFEDLRWLNWDKCPLMSFPPAFYPRKLVILELPRSKMRTMRGLNRVFENLKDLDMSKSLYLTTTPDFTKLPCLETLNLEDCRSLEDVHMSIGILVKLVYLKLSGCEKLKSLPDTICNLRALKLLEICNCIRLRALPEKLEKKKSLKELNMRGLAVSGISNSIGNLSEPCSLSLVYNKNLRTLPNISRCKDMELSQAALSSNLRKLYLKGNSLTALPYSIGLHRNLRSLTIERSVDLLSSEELPPDLITIEARGCMSLERLPNLSKLKHLEKLDLSDCSSLREIQGLTELTSLRELHLRGCRSSLLGGTLTEHFFQVCSGYGHPIHIYPSEYPYWISQSNQEKGSVVSFGVSHNFLGLTLCFTPEFILPWYSVTNTTKNIVWKDHVHRICGTPNMVVVPRSIFSVGNGEERIEVESNLKIFAIHRLENLRLHQIKRQKLPPPPSHWLQISF